MIPSNDRHWLLRRLRLALRLPHVVRPVGVGLGLHGVLRRLLLPAARLLAAALLQLHVVLQLHRLLRLRVSSAGCRLLGCLLLVSGGKVLCWLELCLFSAAKQNMGATNQPLWEALKKTSRRLS